MTHTGRQLISTLESDGTLTLELVEKEFPEPTGNQVIVKMEAAPINPSDLFLLTMAADLENADYAPGKVVMRVDPKFAAGQAGRFGMPHPVGNEGAGTVVATGDSEIARGLAGQRVSCIPMQAYGDYAIADAAMCLPLGDHSARDGASSFVNPMTALGFAETARAEDQKAIVHSGAASNLGLMLNRICQEDGIALINIVRRQEQVDLLRGQGAAYALDSSQPGFDDQLDAAIDATDAFLGFDPISGGPMADRILRAMERVAVSRMKAFNRYGSMLPKKLYIYGRLDLSPTLVTPAYGFSWTLAGWLLMPVLQWLGQETMARMRQRVLDNLTTTFASSYKRTITLEQMLEKDVMADYALMRTGEKYLVTPG